jgi:hypothetical protein
MVVCMISSVKKSFLFLLYEFLELLLVLPEVLFDDMVYGIWQEKNTTKQISRPMIGLTIDAEIQSLVFSACRSGCSAINKFLFLL